MFKLPDDIKVNTTCPYCFSKSVLNVNIHELEAWRNGEYIQNAFPNMNADDRELLQTGICNDCYPKEEI